MYILAIDPGLDGALALRAPGAPLVIADMPTEMRRLANGKERRVIDYETLVRSIGQAALCDYVLVIEDVGGIPGQAASAAFKFGEGVGVIVGAAMACRMRIERVHPATWKSALRVSADKNEARARASELMPDSAHHWPLKKHDGRAEAALLAYYADQVFGDAT